MITQHELWEMFYYDADDGVLVHRYTVQEGKRMGETAGSPHNAGYIQLSIQRKKYLAHRLIWLYVHGEHPFQIDHINGNRSDNRIINLRECSYSQNHGNRKKQSNNTSGFKGVAYSRSDDRWVVDVCGVRIGQYKTKEEAAKVYDDTARIVFGEFALTNEMLGLR